MLLLLSLLPSYLNISQRHATKDAGVIGGLNVMCVVDEAAPAASLQSHINMTNHLQVAARTGINMCLSLILVLVVSDVVSDGGSRVRGGPWPLLKSSI